MNNLSKLSVPGVFLLLIVFGVIANALNLSKMIFYAWAAIGMAFAFVVIFYTFYTARDM